jgi:predicted DNA-binding transcriptional regulator YafY
MSRPATRVLALLELLQARGLVGGAEIAARLEVDQRTVRRYAQQLVDMGIPVEGARGRYGGYCLRPGYKLPPLMLTDDEAVAVVLGLLAGARLGLPGPALARETALAKIQRVLPAALRDRVAAVADALDVSPGRKHDLPPDTEVLLALAKAARDHHEATITYRSWRGESTERDLDTYGLVWHAGKWYAVGHDHRRGALRTFRLDRISEVRPRGTAFVPPENFDAVAYLHRSLATVPYAHEVEVVLDTTLDEAAARIPPSVATLTEADGAVVMVAHAERLDGMARMLAGLGWPFEIRRPDALRAAVADLAAQLHESVRRIA